MMLRMVPLIVAAVTIQSCVQSVKAQRVCDTYGGVQEMQWTCVRPMLMENTDNPVDILEGFCSQEQAYIECMETQMLEYNCTNTVDIVSAISTTLMVCDDGDVPDWITENAGARMAEEAQDCLNGGERHAIGDCFQSAAKQSPYLSNIRDGPFVVGVETVNRFKDSAFPCIQTVFRNANWSRRKPDCASTKWGDIYNRLVLTIASQFPIGLQIQKSDLVSVTENAQEPDLEGDLRRAVFPQIFWKKRRPMV